MEIDFCKALPGKGLADLLKYRPVLLTCLNNEVDCIDSIPITRIFNVNRYVNLVKITAWLLVKLILLAYL
ncbi:MAG TPA: hypothetical protein DCQ34_11005 [Chitinophagaceae bacterium]|nr:hypothetical protein [Chitinophagaceae bacterium]HCY88846.1 hypothetical protein [Chitinophagaceae bacterium]